MVTTIRFFKLSAYLAITALIFLTGIILYFINQLPDDSSLQDYKPNVMTRVHASNGDLVKEYSREYRIFIPINDIPETQKCFHIRRR